MVESPLEIANLLTIHWIHSQAVQCQVTDRKILSLKTACRVAVAAGFRGRDVKIKRKFTDLALVGTHDLSPARASHL